MLSSDVAVASEHTEDFNEFVCLDFISPLHWFWSQSARLEERLVRSFEVFECGQATGPSFRCSTF